MRIIDLLKKKSIHLNASPKTKSEAIDMLVDLQVKGGNIADKEAYKAGILAREEKGSTAVGEGIAIPHAKSEAVKAPSLSAMTVPDGVDYEALLMTILMDEDFRARLLGAKDEDEFIKVIDDMEKTKYPDEPAAVAESDTGYKVLAVTACPTGIAHTYMAAEALEKAGKKLGISIKVETNGSGGAKNVLTKEDIANCDGIIVAADKTVEMARFDGKKVLKTKVSDGIKIPEDLINRIEAGDAPVYHHEGGAETSADSGDDESFGRKLYKHLMNGVSNMLPFVVAGGIFKAIAFLIDTIGGAPQDKFFGSHFAASAWFMTIGDFAMRFMLPILAGFIAKSIADRPGFLVGVVGGYIAAQGTTFTKLDGDVPSGFLGALLAGFLGGLLMVGLEKLCDHMPKALNGIKPVLIYPLGGLGIIGVMMCAVNPIMGIINNAMNNGLTSLSDNGLEVLLGLAHSTFFFTHKSSKSLRVSSLSKLSGNFTFNSFSNSGIISILLKGGLKSMVHSGLFVNFFPVFLSTSSLPSG